MFRACHEFLVFKKKIRKRFREGVSHYIEGHVFSPNKNEYIDSDVFVHLLICTLYLKFSQNFKGCVPQSSNKFTSAALVLIIQKNTEPFTYSIIRLEQRLY